MRQTKSLICKDVIDVQKKKTAGILLFFMNQEEDLLPLPAIAAPPPTYKYATQHYCTLMGGSLGVVLGNVAL